jgi:peptidyl-prolyl cis-trans isomerase SurA
MSQLAEGMICLGLFIVTLCHCALVPAFEFSAKPQRHENTKTQRTCIYLACLLTVGLFGSLGVVTAGAEEIDRVVVAVNGKIIAESDLRLARNLNTLLLFGRNAPETSHREDQISRLIDLELIRQELENFPLDLSEQSLIETRVEELKSGYAEIGGIAPIMSRLGLQVDELQTYLRLQASILRFVNLRFRPFVSISSEEVQAYYRERLLPRLQEAKSPVPPLDQVSVAIEDILREEKVSSALDAWIKEIRSHSRIEYFSDGTPPAAGLPASEGAKQAQPSDAHHSGMTPESSSDGTNSYDQPCRSRSCR